MKFVHILFGLMMLISINSAIAADCTPDSDYTGCTDNEFSFGDATAYSKMQVSNNLGIFKQGYYVKEAHISYKWTGDKMFVTLGITDLQNGITCNENGCNGVEFTNFGKENKMLIASVDINREYTGCPAFTAWDLDVAPNEDWAWTRSTRGWAGVDNCFDVKVVECYEDIDCSGNLVCDKSGEWQDWTCVEPDPCDGVVCDNICDGDVFRSGGQCSEGQCVYDTEICQTNYECFETQGCVFTGECMEDSECDEGFTCTDVRCVQIEGYCSENVQSCTEEQECNLETNQCVDKGVEIDPVFLAIGGVVVIGSIVALLMRRKR